MELDKESGLQRLATGRLIRPSDDLKLHIKNPEPKRDHGSIKDLKQSIAEVGLINPLTIDEAGNLLAGRRRYQVLMELYGPDYDLDVRVLPVNGNQLKAFAISLAENIHRKNLTEIEEYVAIKEYDELKRKIEGERKPGGKNGVYLTSINGEGWSQAKTAEDLHISQPTISRAIKIATAIEKYPELARIKSGQAVLREYTRKNLAHSFPPLPQDDTRFQLVEGDFAAEYQMLTPESIDIIITESSLTLFPLPVSHIPRCLFGACFNGAKGAKLPYVGYHTAASR